MEALKEQRTISDLSSEYRIFPKLINQWSKRVLEELPRVFSGKKKKEAKNDQALISAFYQQITQLKVELE
ncbi:MAG: hypothetical protein AB1641_25580 [Thermodesulfobacteriota bacterium]